jgi:hypothetical protein
MMPPFSIAWLSHASTKLNDLLLAEIDLPGLAFYALLSAHQPAREIDLPPGQWTPGYSVFRSACSGVM